MKPIERVVLVHRLREVGAQVGFTRFESAAPDIEGEFVPQSFGFVALAHPENKRIYVKLAFIQSQMTGL